MQLWATPGWAAARLAGRPPCATTHVTDDTVIGDPMEAALVVLAGKLGLSPSRLRTDCPRIAEVPLTPAAGSWPPRTPIWRTRGRRCSP